VEKLGLSVLLVSPIESPDRDMDVEFHEFDTGRNARGVYCQDSHAGPCESFYLQKYQRQVLHEVHDVARCEVFPRVYICRLETPSTRLGVPHLDVVLQEICHHVEQQQLQQVLV
ncbi:uncharacterized protein METZ01_LOCUS9142, partial [marine metagenome]